MVNKLDKFRDVIAGVLFFVIALAYYLGSNSLKNIGSSTVNTDFFPKVCGIAMMALSVILIVTSVRRLYQAKNQQEETDVPFEKAGAIRVVFSILLLAIYIALMEPVGFLLMTILYVYLQIMVLTPRNEWKLIRFAAISVIFSVIVYCAFLYGFDVMLPQGILR